MDKPNGPQPSLTVQNLYTIIGQLTVENQLLRAQVQAQQQASEAKVPAPKALEKAKGERA